jgi:hypothetical protein
MFALVHQLALKGTMMKQLERGDEEAIVLLLSLIFILIGVRWPAPFLAKLGVMIIFGYALYRYTCSRQELLEDEIKHIDEASAETVTIEEKFPEIGVVAAGPVSPVSPEPAAEALDAKKPDPPEVSHSALTLNDLDFFNACSAGDLDQIEKMLPSVDVNMKDEYGWTPLGCAMFTWNIEVIELLMDNGADPFVKSNEGWTAYDLAQNNALTDKKIGWTIHLDILAMIDKKLEEQKVRAAQTSDTGANNGNSGKEDKDG